MISISVIVTSLEGGSIEYKQLKDLETKDYNQETISVLYMGLSKLIKCALRLPLSSLKQEVSISTGPDTCWVNVLKSHDAIYQSCKNSSAPLNKGAARALDKNCL